MDSLVKQISKRLRNNNNINILSSEYGCTQKEILAQNIRLYIIDDKMTRKQASHKLGIHISKLNRIMREFKIKNENLPRYNLIRETFVICNELSAYIAGLFWSDGHLSMCRLTITFTKKDFILIDTINRYFYNEYIGHGYDKSRSCYKINIYNMQIRNDFFNLGLKNNDQGRSLPPISKELFRHFLRGLVDGDGHIKFKFHNLSLAGRLSLIEEVVNELNKLHLNDSFIINESPKSKRTTRVDKYGTLNFKRFYQYNIYLLLYKNSHYYLPRKFQELNNRFSSQETLINYLRRKHNTHFVFKNKKLFSKVYGNSIKYAFPVLFEKNYTFADDLKSNEQELRSNLLFGKSYNQITSTLKKKGIKVSESSTSRYCKWNNLLTKQIQETQILAMKKSYIEEKIKSAAISKSKLAAELKVDRRRLYRSTKNIHPENHIKITHADYFDSIDSIKKAFFLGFILMRNSLNRKFLNIKFSNSKYCPVIQYLAKELYGVNTSKVNRCEEKYKYSFGSVTLVRSLNDIGIHKRSIGVIKKVNGEYHNAFLQGILHSKLTVLKIKSGYYAQISGDVSVIEWVMSYLRSSYNLSIKTENGNPRKAVFLMNDYSTLISNIGPELHYFLIKGEFSFLSLQQ